MSRVMKVWLTVCIGFVCSGGATLAYGDWSQGGTQNYPPEAFGPSAKMESFIIPGASPWVAFEAPSSISTFPGSSSGWTGVLPDTNYSLSTGPHAGIAYPTTYFSGSPASKFDVDDGLWDGCPVAERQEFEWLGGAWENQGGNPMRNAYWRFDRGHYHRTGDVPIPIPSTMVLLGPACLGILLFRRGISGAMRGKMQ